MDEAKVGELLRRHGQTYAAEAGIRLADKPGPLYQLLVLATLLSARISADIGVAAARELFAAGFRSPRAMVQSGWQDRVDALGRAHYKRYDERTATMLGDGADLLLGKYHGDPRRLRDGDDIAGRLTEFPGIGPAGAGIFLREVQGVWPSVCPYVDSRMAEGARRAGLPDDERELGRVVVGSSDPAGLAAALVRVSRGRQTLSILDDLAAGRGSPAVTRRFPATVPANPPFRPVGPG